MGDTAHKTEDGLPKVYPSCRPHGTTTFFAGAGDDVTKGVGQGEKLLFNLSVNDPSKLLDLTFKEDIWIKDGYMITRNAPFGASMDIEVIHPVAGVVGCFGREIPLLGSGWFPLDTEDRSLLAMGLILRITVRNAEGGNVQDSPADFQVAGRIEMYRKETV